MKHISMLSLSLYITLTFYLAHRYLLFITALRDCREHDYFYKVAKIYEDKANVRYPLVFKQFIQQQFWQIPICSNMLSSMNIDMAMDVFPMITTNALGNMKYFSYRYKTGLISFFLHLRYCLQSSYGWQRLLSRKTEETQEDFTHQVFFQAAFQDDLENEQLLISFLVMNLHLLMKIESNSC